MYIYSLSIERYRVTKSLCTHIYTEKERMIYLWRENNAYGTVQYMYMNVTNTHGVYIYKYI